MKEGYKQITVTVMVPDGDRCIAETKVMRGICPMHIARACKLFNRVIHDHQKCDECKDA